MLLAGLDIGTTGCKVAVYSDTGEYLGKTYRDYPVTRGISAHEVDAGSIWDAVCQAIFDAARKFPGIGGIGVTSFGETFVLLDGNDQPLLPSILYTDPRGEAEARELEAALGRETIIRETGVEPAAMYSLPKMMWVRKMRPDIWAQVRHICQMEDYIVYILTGKAQIDYSLAARTMAFDIHKLSWSETLLEAAGVDMSLLSEPVPTGTVAGHVKPNIAVDLGLDPNTVIVSISHDQVAAAVGSGVFDETCSVDGAGTVECITPVFETYDPMAMAAGKYAVIPYVTPGKYVTYAFSFTGGALADWFVRNLAGYAKTKADSEGTDIHAVLETGYSGGPTGLLVLPHFSGAATPYMDSGSRGAVIGLTLASTASDIYLACMEGVVYEMRLNMERLRDAGVEICALRAAGGGARSEVWMQMKADILGIPVTALRSEEAGAAGSAMLVGLACGVFPDLESAAKRLVRPVKTFFPREEFRAAYDEIYGRYRHLYDSLRPLF